MAKLELDDKSIAYELLIELLAHQFAFPVQWIETQKSLMTGTHPISRMVELGPSKTLTTMGQRTAQRQVASGEIPADSSIQFYASTKNTKELLYQYDEAVPIEENVTAEDLPAPDDTAEVSKAVVQNIQPAIATVKREAIDDIPVQGVEIVRTLIARKLKKPIHDISVSKSIKDLCGGKSTLQNELIGDFSDEFGNFPDRAEDVLLQDLANTLGTVQKLGKTSSALVTKLLASKMPSKYSKNASIESYLASKWNLGPMRQLAILLHAVASEPPSRIVSVDDADKYWDGLVSDYGKLFGLNLQAGSIENDTAINSQAQINPSALNKIMESHHQLATKQYEVLADYLRGDKLDSGINVDLQSQVLDLQHQLDAWHAEFSQEFRSDIEGKFDANKIRQYRSSWNNARQQLLAFHQGTSFDELLHDEGRLNSFIWSLRNRADAELVTMADSLAFDSNGIDDVKGRTSLRIAQEVARGIHSRPIARATLSAFGPRTTISATGAVEFSEVPRQTVPEATTYVDFLCKTQDPSLPPAVSLGRYDSSSSEESIQTLTKQLLQAMSDALDAGISFDKKVVLITGAGPSSIGSELVRLLLAGGACVIVTTHREPSQTAKYFQSLYETCGSKDSELYLVPFNQASAQDCERLIDHIYDSKGLGKDLDVIVPFAATPEGGIEMNEIGTASELAHRLMLVNVFRLLGRIVKNKRQFSIDCNPTLVLLPLSPNHGIFGGDGLYPESKLSLETLLNRVKSETWSDELSICGVRIGWTRSTGLMAANDIVAEAVEKQGVLTFSASEMAFNMAVLMTRDFIDLCEDGPVHADFGGRLGAQGDDFSEFLIRTRREINLASSIARAVKEQDDQEQTAILSASQVSRPQVKRKAMIRVGFPRLPENPVCQDITDHPITHPAEAVVVVGFSELGPWGSSRTRWEMESQGKLSVEGFVELAWLMNLIHYFEGVQSDGTYYIGWVDTKTGKAVADTEIEHNYGEHIYQHAGIRFHKNADRDAASEAPTKDIVQEIVVEQDLPAFETSLSNAEALRLKYRDNVSIDRVAGSENTCQVRIRRGATIMVTKTVATPWASVAGRLPDGWTAARYGVSDDIAKQVDPVTLYTVCCVAEAFYSAGITDPFEVFEHMHLSEFGNFIGSSMGGVLKTRQLYRDPYLDQEIQADTLQDTYLNTAAAWVNMLLLGATGPIKTPVGACATGVESIDSGFESIMAGKTKMCVVGGYDDIQEEETFGFTKMKATANVAAELARGRVPSEMSRPTAESRAGFVESHGCGVQILCRGDIALEMGLPIYGIIAGSTMAADKIGRSVPAPGKGILTFAKEKRNEYLASATVSVDGSLDSELDNYAPSTSVDGLLHSSPAPLRAALAAWGLTVDDLDLASLHGTSTQANDLNEPDVLCKQMSHLGRTPGNPMWAVCQKSITGHPKAPAAAWMLNGCLQAIGSGFIPGNRNADSVDMRLRNKHHLCFPTTTVKSKDGLRAFLLTSFGFGQKSGQIVGVAPRYLFHSLLPTQYQEYSKKTKTRQARADRAYLKAMMSNKIVQVKEKPPYDDDDAPRIFLDPSSRIRKDSLTGQYGFEQENQPGDRC